MLNKPEKQGTFWNDSILQKYFKLWLRTAGGRLGLWVWCLSLNVKLITWFECCWLCGEDSWLDGWIITISRGKLFPNTVRSVYVCVCVCVCGGVSVYSEFFCMYQYITWSVAVWVYLISPWEAYVALCTPKTNILDKHSKKTMYQHCLHRCSQEACGQ